MISKSPEKKDAADSPENGWPSQCVPQTETDHGNNLGPSVCLLLLGGVNFVTVLWNSLLCQTSGRLKRRPGYGGGVVSSWIWWRSGVFPVSVNDAHWSAVAHWRIAMWSARGSDSGHGRREDMDIRKMKLGLLSCSVQLLDMEREPCVTMVLRGFVSGWSR